MDVSKDDLPYKPWNILKKTNPQLCNGTKAWGRDEKISGHPRHKATGKNPQGEVKKIELSGKDHPEKEQNEKIRKNN